MAHETHQLSRRSFLRLAAGSLTMLPAVAGGVLVSAPAAYGEESAEPQAATHELTIVATRVDQVCVSVIDVKDGRAGARAIVGAKVKVTSYFNEKSVEGTTDERGVAILTIADLAEDDPKASGVYTFSAFIEAAAAGYRIFKTGLATVTGGKGLELGTQPLEPGVPYPSRVSFDDWDVLYTNYEFCRDERNDYSHVFAMELEGLAQTPLTIRLVDNDTERALLQGTTTPKSGHATITFKGRYLQDVNDNKDLWPLGGSFLVQFEQGGMTYEHPIALVVRSADGKKGDTPKVFDQIVKLSPLTSISKLLEFEIPKSVSVLGGAKVRFLPDLNFPVMVTIDPWSGVYAVSLNLRGLLGDKLVDPQTGVKRYADFYGWKTKRGVADPDSMSWHPYKTPSEQFESIFKDTPKDAAKLYKQLRDGVTNNQSKSRQARGMSSLDGVWDSSFKVSLWLTFAAKWSQKANVYQVNGGCIAVNVSLDKSFSKPFMVGYIPMFLALRFGVNATAALSALTSVTPELFSFSKWEWDSSTQLLNVTIVPSITLSLGIGINGFVSVALTGNVSFTIVLGFNLLANPTNKNVPKAAEGKRIRYTVSFAVRVGVTVQLLLVTIEKTWPAVDKPNFIDNWRDDGSGMSVQSLEEMAEHAVRDYEATSFLDMLDDPNCECTVVSDGSLAALVEAVGSYEGAGLVGQSSEEADTDSGPSSADDLAYATMDTGEGSFGYWSLTTPVDGPVPWDVAPAQSPDGVAEGTASQGTSEPAATDAAEAKEPSSGAQDEPADPSSDVADGAGDADASGRAAVPAATGMPEDQPSVAVAPDPGSTEAVGAAQDRVPLAGTDASEGLSPAAYEPADANKTEDPSGQVPESGVAEAARDQETSLDATVAARDQASAGDAANADATEGEPPADAAHGPDGEKAEGEKPQSSAADEPVQAQAERPSVANSFVPTRTYLTAQAEGGGGVKGIGRDGGLIPNNDVQLVDNVLSDPRTKVVDILDTPHVFRIGVASIGDAPRTRVLCQQLDGTKRGIGTRVLDTRWAQRNYQFYRSDLYDYDFDVYVEQRAGANGFVASGYIHLLVVSGYRAQGERTPISKLATDQAFGYALFHYQVRQSGEVVFFDDFGLLFPATNFFWTSTATVAAHKYHMFTCPHIMPVDPNLWRGESLGVGFSPMFVSFLDRAADHPDDVFRTDESAPGTGADPDIGLGLGFLQVAGRAIDIKFVDTGKLGFGTIGDYSIYGMSCSEKLPGTEWHLIQLYGNELTTPILVKTRNVLKPDANGVPNADVDPAVLAIKQCRYPSDGSEDYSACKLIPWKNGAFLATVSTKVTSDQADTYGDTPGYDSHVCRVIIQDIEGEPSFVFSDAGVKSIGVSSFCVDAYGETIYWPALRDDAPVYEVGEEGEQVPTDKTDSYYAIMAAEFWSSTGYLDDNDGVFSEPYVFAEVAHRMDSLVMPTRSAWNYEEIEYSPEVSFISTQIVDAKAGVANLWYTSMPPTRCLTVTSVLAENNVVLPGKSVDINVGLRNDGNEWLKCCQVNVRMLDGTVVYDDLLVFDAETLVESNHNPRREDGTLENVAFDYWLAPGKSGVYRISFPVPGDWSGENNIVVRVTTLQLEGNDSPMRAQGLAAMADEAVPSEWLEVLEDEPIEWLMVDDGDYEVGAGMLSPAPVTARGTAVPSTGGTAPAPASGGPTAQAKGEPLPWTGEDGSLGRVGLAAGALGAAMVAYSRRRNRNEDSKEA